MSGSGILGRIAAERAEDAARRKKARPASRLVREAGAPRPLFRATRPPFVIAECKRASPSAGLIVADYDAARLAAAYERGGAAAVSVLTEPRHFLGSNGHLAAARAATHLPVLRKDFIVDTYQVLEAWAMGADAVLLIAAILDRARVAELAACARELGLETLFEIHDEAEVDLVDAANADAVGVNSRNLSTFAVDSGRPGRLASLLPAGLPRVAESGLHSGAEAAALLRSGYDAFLVGELFARADDPEAAVRGFTGALLRAAERGGGKAAAASPGGEDGGSADRGASGGAQADVPFAVPQKLRAPGRAEVEGCARA